MDYAGLKSRIIDELSDAQVDDAKAAEFIEQAEYKLARDLMAPGGVPRQMMTRVTGSSDSEGKYQLPSDFIKARTVVTNQRLHNYVSPEHVLNANGYADAPLTVDYYQSIPALSDSNTTNWLLSAAADLYLYAACLQYPPYAEDEAYAGWRDYYSDALMGVKLTFGPQPQGGFSSQKRRAYTAFYTVIGDYMYFGSGGVAP